MIDEDLAGAVNRVAQVLYAKRTERLRAHPDAVAIELIGVLSGGPSFATTWQELDPKFRKHYFEEALPLARAALDLQ